MNIVKGVADLIRRSSSVHHGGDTSSATAPDRFTLPPFNISFSEVGSESILQSLWEKHVKAVDQVEKKRLFQVFLSQFVDVHSKWEPIVSGEWADSSSSTVSHVESFSQSGNLIVGCFAGHPTELLVALIDEITQLTTVVTEMESRGVKSSLDPATGSTSSRASSDGLPVLEAMLIAVRSLHNCRVLGYFGMVQKLIALIKAAVVQLKAIAGAFTGDDSLSDLPVDTLELLQKLLVHVVSILCNFIDLSSNAHEMAHFYDMHTFSLASGSLTSKEPFDIFKVHHGKLHPWKQSAIMSVMEAGGLNWLVELLRVMRRLSMKELSPNLSLQYLTLRALHSALTQNSRAQNHFRSIGGLEVLLDGLGLPSNNAFITQTSNFSARQRNGNIILAVFQLHVLSLEVLREAVFGNLTNLQFLCENGRVHKFANSFCATVFVIQEQWGRELSVNSIKGVASRPDNGSNYEGRNEEPSTLLYVEEIIKYWHLYVVTLSESLCSFILADRDNSSDNTDGSNIRYSMLVSPLYVELSIKWVLKVLQIVFPCIKACANLDMLPTYVRIFVSILQHQVVHTCQQVLSSSPMLLEVLRREGIWELVFSENFFYFGATLDGHHEVNRLTTEVSCISSCNFDDVLVGEALDLQMECISFADFAATSSVTAHNLEPEKFTKSLKSALL